LSSALPLETGRSGTHSLPPGETGKTSPVEVSCSGQWTGEPHGGMGSFPVLRVSPAEKEVKLKMKSFSSEKRE